MRSQLTLSSLTLFATLVFPLLSHAGFKGSVSFTDQEKADHVRGLPVILETAADCIQTDLRKQKEFYRKYGISAFYGDRSAFSRLSTSDKRATIASLGADPALLKYMEPTSCVGMARKCLGRGFEAAGQGAVWKRIQDYTIQNGVDGTAMQDGLQKLGWKVLYWNPDTRQNAHWDREELLAHPDDKDHFKGQHAYNWMTLNKKRKYLYNNVDDIKTLVDFGTKMPEALKSIPFFIGTAHMGYHVFPGTFGQVIEAHSTRRINDPKTVESAMFNPIGGGGPTDGEYRTGLIAVPPGYTR